MFRPLPLHITIAYTDCTVVFLSFPSCIWVKYAPDMRGATWSMLDFCLFCMCVEFDCSQLYPAASGVTHDVHGNQASIVWVLH